LKKTGDIDILDYVVEYIQAELQMRLRDNSGYRVEIKAQEK
jgi:hypothetical protein